MIFDIVDTLFEWFLLPGATVTAWLGEHAPAIADFLRLGSDGANQTTISTTVSVVSSVLLVLLLGYLLEVFRNLDRHLTSYVSGRYAECRRLLRILRRRIQSRIGLMRQRAREPEIIVSEIELERLEASVLRCYGGAGELHVLAANEIAARLRVSKRQVEKVIGRLMDHHLVERAFGTDQGREAHRITRAGQIYLIER